MCGQSRPQRWPHPPARVLFSLICVRTGPREPQGLADRSSLSSRQPRRFDMIGCEFGVNYSGFTFQGMGGSACGEHRAVFVRFK